MSRSRRNRRSRVCAARGLTLVELLVTITILSMLASIVLFAMNQAQDKARANRTEATIRRLDSVITRHWESFQTRKIPLQMPNAILNSNTQCAAFRLNSMRQMQMYELPDRYNEILNFPIGTGNPEPFSANPTYNASVTPGPYTQVDPPWNVYVTAFHRAYFVRCNTNSLVGTGPTSPSLTNQAAECLYLIANVAGGAGSGVGVLQENYPWVDVDNDGMREVADGWGRPITFVRWPAGFVSSSTMFLGERQTGDVTNDHDPFDWLGVDAAGSPPTTGFRLHPLIFSAGRDAQDGIMTRPNDPWTYRIGPPSTPVSTRTIGGLANCIDPYVTTVAGRIGSPIGTVDWRDNIHNHMQAYK